MRGFEKVDMKRGHIHIYIYIYVHGHHDYQTESAQWANSVKQKYMLEKKSRRSSKMTKIL